MLWLNYLPRIVHWAACVLLQCVVNCTLRMFSPVYLSMKQNKAVFAILTVHITYCLCLMVQLPLVYSWLNHSTTFYSRFSFAYSHRNVFGRNQKLNISLERGQVDLIVRANYTDPWIQGDDKRTSRTIMIQVISKVLFV